MLPAVRAAAAGAGRRGRIVNVTSVHGDIPSTGSAAHGAAKGGLRDLTRALALEVAPDRITVNNVASGLTDAPMAAGVLRDPEKAAAAAKEIPPGRA